MKPEPRRSPFRSRPERILRPSATRRQTVSAKAGQDYTNTAGSFTGESAVPAGGSREITVPILDDALDEINPESFTVKLANVTVAELGADTATINLTDNDAPPKVTIEDAGAVAEGGTAKFAVKLDAPSGRTSE